MRGNFASALGNLGLLLQANGVILLIPILASIVWDEPISTLFLSLASVASLAAGFILSSTFKNRELTFESISILIVFTYLGLGLTGTIPYLLPGIFNSNPLEVFSNGFFESMAGYTTAGLSLLDDVETLPRSLLLFRSLAQWLGGVSIIYLMILFFTTPGTWTKTQSDIVGLGRVKPSARGTFLEIVKIYLIFTLVFALLLFLAGISIFHSFNLAFTGISTAGFLPVNGLDTLLTTPVYIILSAMMIVGATSFTIHSKLLGGKFKGFYKWEVAIMIFLILLAIVVAVALIPSGDSKSIAFHVVSASTTAGFSFMNISDQPNALKMLLITLMFVGGTSFSTAGGIKIFRLIVAFKGISWLMKRASAPEDAVVVVKVGDKMARDRDLLIVVLSIFLTIFILALTTFAFLVYGFGFGDSVFEIVAALSTGGLSTGLTSQDLPLPLRWLLTTVMMLGRMEIIPFLIFVRALAHIDQR
ncbi:MAG: TrkH family potassium uptake protein [Nitrososphaerales archaeon]